MAEATEAGSVAELVHPLAVTAEVQQEPAQPGPEAATQAEAEGEEGAEQKEEKPARTYTQEEVDRIVRKAKKNSSYLTRKETEAEFYRQIAEERQQSQAKATAVPGAQPPKRDDFDSFEEYLEARSDWRTDQKFAERMAQQNEVSLRKAEEVSAQEQSRRFYAQMDKARESIADFDEVMDAASEAPVTQTMRAAIMESEVGALLTYHLAKNPAEAQRISRLSPVAQFKAIGAIEATLQRKPEPQVSKAPAPIKPLSGGSGGVADPAKMPMEDYIAHRKKQGAAWARR